MALRCWAEARVCSGSFFALPRVTGCLCVCACVRARGDVCSVLAALRLCAASGGLLAPHDKCDCTHTHTHTHTEPQQPALVFMHSATWCPSDDEGRPRPRNLSHRRSARREESRGAWYTHVAMTTTNSITTAPGAARQCCAPSGRGSPCPGPPTHGSPRACRRRGRATPPLRWPSRAPEPASPLPPSP